MNGPKHWKNPKRIMTPRLKNKFFEKDLNELVDGVSVHQLFLISNFLHQKNGWYQMKMNFGLCPFWFWNGAMTDDEIQNQINHMKEEGIGGFMIQPRMGLEIPYLGQEWFEKVRLAVETAKECGLDVWLSDEYPYPTGNAGGQVLLEHPEYAAAELKTWKLDISGDQELIMDLPWGKAIWAAAYPVHTGTVDWNHPLDLAPAIGTIGAEPIFQMSGLTPYNKKRFFFGKTIKRLQYKLPPGNWRVYIFMQVTMEHMKFFGKFIDPLNKQAVACFIQETHEKYYQYLGPEFGKTIKGFFADEIDLQPHDADLRWSPLLPELFLKNKGYTLIPNLPALLDQVDQKTAKIRYDYWDVLTTEFMASFDSQVADWCRNHQVLYAAEKPILRSRQLQYMDVPGIDAGHQKVNTVPAIANKKYRANAKLLGSAAHFYGKGRALCECFHSVGWGMTLQDMKWMIDWLGIQGVNLFVPHAFFYTTDGLAKHDAPPSSFYQNPSWPQMHILSNHVKTLSQLGSDYRQQVEILVIDPITSQWTAMLEPHDLKNRLTEDFSKLQQSLLRNHFDFYIIDPQELSQGRIDGPGIAINNESFSIVILPPMLNLEKAAREKIKEFVASGGTLLATQCLPVENIDGAEDFPTLLSDWFAVDANTVYQQYRQDSPAPVSIRNQTHGQAIFVPTIEELPENLALLTARPITIISGGKENNAFLVNHYIQPEKIYLLALNVSGETQSVEIHWGDFGLLNPILEEVSMEDPAQKDFIADFHCHNGHGSFKAEFAPYQSKLYRLQTGKLTAQSTSRTPPKNDILWLDPQAKWQISVQQMNTARFDQWELQIDSVGPNHTPYQGVGPGRVRCRPIINQMAESGMYLPVVLSDYFGCPLELVFPPLDCRYRTQFQIAELPSSAAWLVMEPGSIQGQWQLAVNGHPFIHQDFQSKPVYLPSNLGVEVTSLLKSGLNELELQVSTNHNSDGLINPLYLCGPFGVYQTTAQKYWTIDKLPEESSFSQESPDGLPCYAGIIRYRRKMVFDQTPSTLRLGIKGIENPIELLVNGHSAGVRPWEPFVWDLAPEYLQPGENLLEFKVTTTLLGLLEGSRFDPKLHRYVEI
ncbi:MAG TPA: hypothetical protein DDW50_14605 [Firmicutes bacterium]|jgi:hypothetical protein|nr:hypothetical protein [Bacillota bacterium]